VIGWLDCAAGASGDMLLGALVDAGVPLAVPQDAVGTVGPATLRAEPVTRHGIGATKLHVTAPGDQPARTWAEIRTMLTAAALAPPVRDRALDVFARLARAEAAVHRTDPDDVHFHEVGAVDAVADVVGVCAALHHLGLATLTASRVTLGSGTTRGEHGLVPVPGPAVLHLLADAGAPVHGGPAPAEMCTPTGAALLAAHVDSWGPLPELVITRTGYGAGARDLAEVPNVVRLVLGEPVAGPRPALLISANVDDLDPRLWPAALAALLAAGAADAWLAPILMKKGRPAHTLHVLTPPAAAPAVRRAIFAHTSTIGLRESTMDKHELARETRVVDVDGHAIRVKIARLDGRTVNSSVEYEDVTAAAAALGVPAKLVLARATAAALELSP
jgi:hypothetical protein